MSHHQQLLFCDLATDHQHHEAIVLYDLTQEHPLMLLIAPSTGLIQHCARVACPDSSFGGTLKLFRRMAPAFKLSRRKLSMSTQYGHYLISAAACEGRHRHGSPRGRTFGQLNRPLVQILAVGSCPSRDPSDRFLLGDKFPRLWNLPSDVASADALNNISVARYKRCTSPQHRGTNHIYLIQPLDGGD